MGSELEGRLSIVTGGGGAIGSVAVEALTGLGAEVVICGRTEGRLAAVAERVAGPVHTFAMDASDEREWRRLQEFVTHGWSDGPVALVTAAGINHRERFLDSSVEHWNEMWQINVVGSMLAARAVLPAMTQGGFGRIVHVSSVGAHIGLTERCVYAATKGAIEAFARSLAAEVGGSGVTVNCLAPGAMPTELNQRWLDNRPEMRDGMLGAIPEGRFGGPRELLEAFRFLMLSPYSQGSSVVVDGGWTAV